MKLHFTSFCYLCHNSELVMVRKDILNIKVLLKLSSFVKFSQNFKSREDNRQWHHIIGFVLPSVASYISFGVGYCLYQRLRQCEKPHGCGKDNKFPHLLFYLLLSGNWIAQNKFNKNENIKNVRIGDNRCLYVRKFCILQ